MFKRKKAWVKCKKDDIDNISNNKNLDLNSIKENDEEKYDSSSIDKKPKNEKKLKIKIKIVNLIQKRKIR